MCDQEGLLSPILSTGLEVPASSHQAREKNNNKRIFIGKKEIRVSFNPKHHNFYFKKEEIKKLSIFARDDFI